MNQNERIAYQVAVKVAGDAIISQTSAADLLKMADDIYAGMMGRFGDEHPADVAAQPVPADTEPPPTDPGARFKVGDPCPKCQAAALILKTNREGSKAWLQCADKKVQKSGTQWIEVGPCVFGPYDESVAYEVRMALWQS